MKLDTYTKLVLTVIALGLWGIFLQPLIMPKEVGAFPAILDVNIKQIDGRNIDSVLDVNIEKINGRTIYDKYLPVEIKK
jgi:hypothetical protein